MTGWTSALLAASTAAATVVLSGCSTSVANAATVLQGAVGTSVVHPDGRTLAGVDGLRLHAGDVVRTGNGGRAALVTQGRVVYVGSDAAVTVINGATEELRHGAAVVDALHGPGLRLQVANLVLETSAGTAVRAERSVTVRVGSLAGQATVSSSTGRRLTIPPLGQAVVGGDALPATTTPLQLTDDDGEARTVPDLVHDDETLNSLARGIDNTGATTARVVDAAWPGPLAPAPAGTGRSEKVLPAVIAAAGPATGRLQRYATAVRDRSAGGSWGVVAHLVGVPASGVVAALASFERHQPGQAPTVRQILAQAAQATTQPRTGGGHQPGNNGNGNGNGGGGHPTPSPSPSPSPSGPVGAVVGTVRDTVGQVLTLLPTPSPTRSSRPVVRVTLPPLP